MSARHWNRVELVLTYNGDGGVFVGLGAVKLTTDYSGTSCVTFVLDGLMSSTAPYLIGIPAIAETSEGERWHVWFSDAGLTLETAGLAA